MSTTIQEREKHSVQRVFPATVWKAFLSPNNFLAFLPILLITAFIFYAESWGFSAPLNDPANYQCYVLSFWFGSNAAHALPPPHCQFMAHITLPPYKMFPLEYPPLTMTFFSLGLLAPIAYYQAAFAVLMAVAALVLYWLLLNYGPRGAHLAFAGYLLLGAGATAFARFDLVPAGLTILSVMAADRKKWTLSYVALAFAVLTKFYPILVWPVVFLAEQRAGSCLYLPEKSLKLRTLLHEFWRTVHGLLSWRWKNSILFFAILVVVTGIFALVNFEGTIMSPLKWFTLRPIQVETTSSSLLWLASLFGLPLHFTVTYESLNTISSINTIISGFVSVAFVIGYLTLLLLTWRGKLDVVQGAVAVFLVCLSTGKVFSPQYIIWLMPLLAYNSGLRRFWLMSFGLIAFFTTIVFPILYLQIPVAYEPPLPQGFLPMITLRNALLVFVTLAFLCDWFQIRQRAPLHQIELRKMLYNGN